ncbi:imidazole glycerol phosphate synthase subunit HisH [Sphingomonas bacterium]|uniref:imidazole glycerol phosphate synthase subunit HisH n=1 Tax=Sphingomonas bacterium TaxID=1895847 RepID=UPI00157515A7|nr:imidazole glycerol phosphate synthase subunit HisH [Sphingomonas bacterium]
MTLALIDIESGNLHSVANALRAAGCDHLVVTAEPEAVRAAERIVLPGVGAFGRCAANLRGVPGLEEALREAVLRQAVPFLGICVGMQLMADAGDEMGEHAGLGWIGGRVRLLTPADPAAKVPHMGWNDVVPATPHPLIEPGEAYFLHSYAFEPAAAGSPDILATTDHAGPVVAAIGRDTMIGVQFHPEKSSRYGLALLRRFLAWAP